MRIYIYLCIELWIPLLWCSSHLHQFLAFHVSTSEGREFAASAVVIAFHLLSRHTWREYWVPSIISLSRHTKYTLRADLLLLWALNIWRYLCDEKILSDKRHFSTFCFTPTGNGWPRHFIRPESKTIPHLFMNFISWLIFFTVYIWK